MEVVEDEQPFFSTVSYFLIDVGFVNPASSWALKECSVVDSAHVVAGTTEPEWNPQNKYCSVDPAGMIPLIEAKKIPFEYVWRENW